MLSIKRLSCVVRLCWLWFYSNCLYQGPMDVWIYDLTLEDDHIETLEALCRSFQSWSRSFEAPWFCGLPTRRFAMAGLPAVGPLPRLSLK